MSKSRGDELNDHHNEGQADGSRNKYDPPHSITPLDHFIHSDEFVDHMIEDNKAYDKGYKEGRNKR